MFLVAGDTVGSHQDPGQIRVTENRVGFLFLDFERPAPHIKRHDPLADILEVIPQGFFELSVHNLGAGTYQSFARLRHPCGS